jgi:diguanylate cyclase (GGDEF)-like protein/PAS domain S-box-containing protein
MIAVRNGLRRKRGPRSRPVSEDPSRLALAALRATGLGILVTDARGRIQMTNPAFTRITGYDFGEVEGANPRILRSGRHDPGFYERMWADLREQGHWSGEIWNRRRSGEAYPELLTIDAVLDERGEVRNYVGVFCDISSRKSAERKLARLAYSDPLTGLPNRALLADRCAQALAQARRNYWTVALLIADLDDFKSINDAHGHPFGDAVLRAIAERLASGVRAGDTVARAGGDEFVILLPHVERPQDAAAVAGKVLQTLRPELTIQGRRVTVGASVGIGLYPSDGRTADDLLDKADVALYRVKQRGKNGYLFYREESAARPRASIAATRGAPAPAPAKPARGI